jgi:hypothetical protein
MPTKDTYIAMYHGVNLDTEPIKYKDRNNTTIIICGTEGTFSTMNPLIWLLQYYAQFYEDFVKEFVNFHFQYLGDNYIHTYRQSKISNDGKYNHIFKLMMKEHFLYLETVDPNSKLQIFSRTDSIANLTLTASDEVIMRFSLPLFESDINNFTKQLNTNNLLKYFQCDLLPRPQKQSKEYHLPLTTTHYTSIHDKLVNHAYFSPMGLSDRMMNVIPHKHNTNLYEVCQKLPPNNFLILTACRGLDQVMKTQIYRNIPSLQQIINKLQHVQLRDKPKRKRQQQQKSSKKLKK